MKIWGFPTYSRCPGSNKPFPAWICTDRETGDVLLYTSAGFYRYKPALFHKRADTNSSAANFKPAYYRRVKKATTKHAQISNVKRQRCISRRATRTSSTPARPSARARGKRISPK